MALPSLISAAGVHTAPSLGVLYASHIRSLSRSLDAAVGEIALLGRAQRGRRLQLAMGAGARAGPARHDAMGAVHCPRGEVQEGELAASPARQSQEV
jgi:hypothetical protein